MPTTPLSPSLPSLLDATFLHAPRVGKTVEQRLWQAGFLTWESLLGTENPKDAPLTTLQRESLLPVLERSMVALESSDWLWLAQNIPTREHWRMANLLRDTVGYVDIETNGGYDAEDITIIGIYDGSESRIYIKDDAKMPIYQFRDEHDKISLWVSFFGSAFDLPFLRRRFADKPFNQPHVDLCHALGRLGYKGGLKKIERDLGIGRSDEIEGVSGYEAIHLWNQWEYRQDKKALEKLVAYNKADIENLETLLDFALPKLIALSGYPIAPITG
jgi:uncharacterized protein